MVTSPAKTRSNVRFAKLLSGWSSGISLTLMTKKSPYLENERFFFQLQTAPWNHLDLNVILIGKVNHSLHQCRIQMLLNIDEIKIQSRCLPKEILNSSSRLITVG